jgi:hypothetical protein
MGAEVVLPAGPLKYLHIDKARLTARMPDSIAIRVEGHDEFIYAVNAWIQGESAFRLEPDDPLPPNGTYAWMETYAQVTYWTP